MVKWKARANLLYGFKITHQLLPVGKYLVVNKEKHLVNETGQQEPAGKFNPFCDIGIQDGWEFYTYEEE